MPWFIAIRDNDTQKPVSVDETDEGKMEAAYAAARDKYPPPQYDLQLVFASSLDAFLKGAPRFRGAAPKEAGGGTSAGTTPTPSTPPPAKPAA